MNLLRAAFAALALVAAAPALSDPGPPVDESEIAVGEALPYAFFAKPEGDGPFPAIILLGGSDGGDRAARSFAPRFLELGYAVLGLPYYSPAYFGQPQQLPGLPRAFADIPLDKLATARDRLKAREDVDGDHVGLYGVSKGAEFALAGASRVDGFAAVVAIVPSDVIWEGWGPGTTPGEVSSFSWQGEPLPFVPYLGMQEEFAKYSDPDATPYIRGPHDAGRRAAPERVSTARILVEEIDEPVLVAGGDRDVVWNSGLMAQNVAERRAEKDGLVTEVLIFPSAGHYLSGVGVQNTKGDWRIDDDTLAAQQKIWPATVAFLARYLKPE